AMMLHERVSRSRSRRPEGEPPAAEPTTPQPPKEKITIDQLEAMFVQLGENYAAKVAKEASYLGTFKARVINCSFGSENKSLCQVFKQNMVQEWGWENPSDAEVQQVVNLFVEKALLAKDKALFAQCPEALFCIAAGNSSEDLDEIVTSPNDVPIDNKLVVAATLENKKIADFSCHGVTKVDVAVPGVNIYATYPNGKMGFMSGTSMACPMAARFATQVLQAHDGLTAVEVKKILMGTVDKKDWLADKVRSSGVINPNRAIHAAKLVKSGKSLDTAIAEALTAVMDVQPRRSPYKGPNLKDKQVRDLYFSAIF
ncbi:MAG TPA: S8 family serine peptidase, partial [Candidatus Ozemobacteraceae bacterium]|nr:S8 family serine peptidase [Candidatus Ozemobacteraceae bacterium]